MVGAFRARGVSLYLLDLTGGADDVSGNGIARLFLTIVSAYERQQLRLRLGQCCNQFVLRRLARWCVAHGHGCLKARANERRSS